MFRKFRLLSVSIPDLIIFILRNIALLGLLLHAYLHFKDVLNPVYLIVAFCLAIIFALWMEKIKLRFLPALVTAILLIIIVRFIFFFIFTLLSPFDTGIEKDFIFFLFDKDFFPALIPSFIAWLFNFLALRKKGFVPVETGLNSLLLVIVFFTQAHFNVTFYHPTFFGLFLASFILVEIAVLVLSQLDDNHRASSGAKKGKNRLPVVFSYFWVLIPLFLLLLFYLFLLNRYNEESTRNKGGLMESTLFRFDFSKYVKLQSEIKLSDDLVLLFRKNGPAERLLLRRFVLSDYKPESGFYQSPKKGVDDIPAVVPDIPTLLDDPGYKAREPVEQEYFFINFDPTSLIAMNYPVKIIPLKNWDGSSFLRIYRVESKVSQLDPQEDLYRGNPLSSFPPEAYAFYTNYGDDDIIRTYAEEITSEAGDYLGKVLAIRDRLKNEYKYSLKPGIAPDGNQLHHFLFNSKKGYCSYFAFAMALMCRSIGIPARVAVGFFANPEWEVLNFYEIKANQAHAWVEVFFEDYGWMEFDPTSTTIAPGEDISFMFGFQFDDRLKNLISEILENQDKLVEIEGGHEVSSQSAFRFPELVIAITSWLLRYWFFTLPSLLLLIILLLKYSPYLFFIASKSRRKKVKYLFLHTLGILYGLRMVRETDESLLEYSERLDRTFFDDLAVLSAWTGSYLKAVFGNEFHDIDYTNALERYRAFKTLFNAKVSLFIRLLGILNPVNSIRRKI
ncbi:MAG: transglutaminase domain-containing protein [Spirochaetales bacterium]|nr:transglutaminase domain-containing protein [Spirochaetales bacterium]